MSSGRGSGSGGSKRDTGGRAVHSTVRGQAREGRGREFRALAAAARGGGRGERERREEERKGQQQQQQHAGNAQAGRQTGE